MVEALLIYLSQDSPDYLLSDKIEYGMKRVPKLGFMYLASVLEQNKVSAVIKDQTIENFTLKTLLDELRGKDYLFIGFYSAQSLKEKVTLYIRSIRENNIITPIVVGGPDFYSAADYLNAGGDIVCHGEGELTIGEIVGYIRGERLISAVKGISYKESGQIRQSQPQQLIENLDSLPMPKRDKDQKMTDYYDFHIFNMRTPYTTMMASRGCVYGCAYCSSCNVWGNRIRQRTPENVISEIDYCVNELGIKYIGFKDDVFGFGNEWISDFCRDLIKKPYKILWSCMVHPFSFIKKREEIMPLLKKAGCDLLIFGLQSAHPEILKNIRRSPKEPQELAETIKVAKCHGITTVAEFIFGLPGETEETIETTVNYALNVRPHYAQFNSLVILEGSLLKKQFPSGGVCKFSQPEIKRLCSSASRKFYTNSRIILQDAVHIAVKNPLWFAKTLKYSPYIFNYLGFSKNENKT